MAVLTNRDYGVLRDSIHQVGSGKEDFRLLPSMPAEAKLAAAFQAVEDHWENNKATLKTAIDTAIGFTTTATLARKIGLAWLFWKMSKGG